MNCGRGGRIIVLDTSLLTEILKVPGRHSEEFARAALQRYKEENQKRSKFYVTVPVLFELADHIAHVDNAHARRDASNKLANIVRSSLDGNRPWSIPIEAMDQEQTGKSLLLHLLKRFEGEFSPLGIGMSDASVIDLSHQIKQCCGKLMAVHIWTRDQAIKSHEPDRELDPLF